MNEEYDAASIAQELTELAQESPESDERSNEPDATPTETEAQPVPEQVTSENPLFEGIEIAAPEGDGDDVDEQNTDAIPEINWEQRIDFQGKNVSLQDIRNAAVKYSTLDENIQRLEMAIKARAESYESILGPEITPAELNPHDSEMQHKALMRMAMERQFASEFNQIQRDYNQLMEQRQKIAEEDRKRDIQATNDKLAAYDENFANPAIRSQFDSKVKNVMEAMAQQFIDSSVPTETIQSALEQEYSSAMSNPIHYLTLVYAAKGYELMQQKATSSPNKVKSNSSNKDGKPNTNRSSSTDLGDNWTNQDMADALNRLVA